MNYVTFMCLQKKKKMLVERYFTFATLNMKNLDEYPSYHGY